MTNYCDVDSAINESLDELDARQNTSKQHEVSMNERYNKSRHHEEEMVHEEEPIDDEPISEEERKPSNLN